MCMSHTQQSKAVWTTVRKWCVSLEHTMTLKVGGALWKYWCNVSFVFLYPLQGHSSPISKVKSTSEKFHVDFYNIPEGVWQSQNTGGCRKRRIKPSKKYLAWNSSVELSCRLVKIYLSFRIQLSPNSFQFHGLILSGKTTEVPWGNTTFNIMLSPCPQIAYFKYHNSPSCSAWQLYGTR